jgi:hypothetical protein
MNYILLCVEFLAALVALIKLKQLKNSYWKWFTYYLIIIFIFELYFKFNKSIEPIEIKAFYNLFGIPIQFIFFYWLYGFVSLKKVKLFYLFVAIYLISYIVVEYCNFEIKPINRFSYLIGTILLFIFAMLEFIKQFKSEQIHNFKTNKMFYINFAILFFYLGTLPFYILTDIIYYKYKMIYDFYLYYAIVSNCIMYLLFTASFIWGKPKRY